MKFVATPIVRHFGFRRVLTVNAVLAGGRRQRRLHAHHAGLADDRRAAGRRLLPLAVQFHRRKYANLCRYPAGYEPRQQLLHARSSWASAWAWVAAVTLNVSMTLRGAETLAIRDVVAGFIVIGLMCAARFSL